MLKDPGRLAWTVLFISLAVFCATTTGIFLGARWFLVDSTVPLTVTLFVGRGTVGVRNGTGESAEEAERSTRFLAPDARLTTDSQSQGFITFTDSYTHEVVASLVLHQDSSITLGHTASPRFSFSSSPYTITVQARGQIDVDIVPDIPRAINFDVHSSLGWARMSRSGRYLLTSQEDRFSVLNRAGEAVIVNRESQARSVPEGMEGRIGSENDSIVVSRTLVDIVPDGGFDVVNPVNPSLPSGWGCYIVRDDLSAPRGSWAREVVRGRSALHITRLEGVRNHAETGCIQNIGQPGEGLPVTQYDYLELRATMLIRYHSLSACGWRGSECPVMLVINYLDPYDVQRRWIHGFYARYDQAAGYPLRCDTCSLDHEKLNPDTWYTYTSGNLLQILPEEQRPAAILSVHFYASGHEYEVMLGEVSLLAGRTSQTGIDAATQPGPTLTLIPDPTPATATAATSAPSATQTPTSTASHTPEAASPATPEATQEIGARLE